MGAPGAPMMYPTPMGGAPMVQPMMVSLFRKGFITLFYCSICLGYFDYIVYVVK